MTEAATRYGQSNNVTALYPVVAVDALATAAEDFHRPLNLEIAFKTEWSAHLDRPDAKKQTALFQSSQDSSATTYLSHASSPSHQRRLGFWVHAKDTLKVTVRLADKEWGNGTFLLSLPEMSS